MQIAWIRDQFASDALPTAASRVFDQQKHVIKAKFLEESCAKFEIIKMNVLE
jgi:hypothetical protein